MDPVALTIGIAWTITGLICLGLSVPLIRGRVGPNRVYGVRFAESFQSDEAWYAINRFGGWQLAVWSIPLLAIGATSFFLPLKSHVGLTLALGFAPLCFILLPVVLAWRYARRLGSRD